MDETIVTEQALEGHNNTNTALAQKGVKDEWFMVMDTVRYFEDLGLGIPVQKSSRIGWVREKLLHIAVVVGIVFLIAMMSMNPRPFSPTGITPVTNTMNLTNFSNISNLTYTIFPNGTIIIYDLFSGTLSSL